MKRVISDVRLCPIARDCRTNQCIMRMTKVFNYPLEPSIESEKQKAKDIEARFGKGYLPNMQTLFRDGSIQIVCPDYTDK